MSSQGPLVSVSPPWYGGLISKWVALPFVVGFLITGFLGDAGYLPVDAVIPMLVAFPLAFSVARSRLSGADLYATELVTSAAPLPGGPDEATIRYDEVAVVVRAFHPYVHETLYVVHSDGVATLRVPEASGFRRVLTERVPDRSSRARGVPRDTAGWLLFEALEDDDLVISEQRAIELLDVDPLSVSKFAPKRLMTVDGVHSVDDVSGGDV